MKIKVQKTNDSVVLPEYQRDGDAGMDLRVNNFKKLFYPVKMSTDNGFTWAESEDNLDSDTKEITLNPGSRALLGTGIMVELPKGYEFQIRPRSGLAIKQGVTVINSPGTIDSNYRGEIGVCVINNGFLPITIKLNERVAQMVLKQVEIVEWEESSLSETERGSNGFGSSGKE